MVRVKPFRGLRPPPEMAAAVAAPPYDVLNSDEARALKQVAGETSFLRVNKPEVDLPVEVNQYDVQVNAVCILLSRTSILWMMATAESLEGQLMCDNLINQTSKNEKNN